MKSCVTALVLMLAGLAPRGAGAWEYPATPGDLTPPLEFVKMTIVTPDSARLATWYVPAQDSAGAVLPGRHPGVLVLPGDRDVMDERLHVVSGLARRGFSVLTFDHRGRGGSSDFFIDRRALLYPEFLEDAHSALFILRRQAEVDTTRLALYGESRGAYLALALAGERPETRAVAAVSPPFSFATWIPVLEREEPDETCFVPDGWKRKWDADKAVDRFNGAILFVAGDRDLTTPAWMAEDLYKRYPRSKDLWIVEGAGHAGPQSPSRFAGERFFGRVSEFLHRELELPPHRGWPDR
jgi:pimeloyl-ACP methyl ester carboxylesterase